MLIPRFWQSVPAQFEVDGKTFAIRAWGHSDESDWMAMENARRRAEEIRRRLAAGAGGEYLYQLIHPIREPLIQEWRQSERQYAAITRNRYGALVLNTAGVMFIDIDYPPPGFFQRFRLGRFYDEQRRTIADRVDETMSRARLTYRLYETRGGIRVMVTSRRFEEVGDDAVRLMEQCQADPLYVRLCQAQRCYRARLSPKPWRIGMMASGMRMPTQDNASAYQQWLREYYARSQDQAVCRLIYHSGSGAADELIRHVLEIHDSHVLNGESSSLK